MGTLVCIPYCGYLNPINPKPYILKPLNPMFLKLWVMRDLYHQPHDKEPKITKWGPGPTMDLCCGNLNKFRTLNQNP